MPVNFIVRRQQLLLLLMSVNHGTVNVSVFIEPRQVLGSHRHFQTLLLTHHPGRLCSSTISYIVDEPHFPVSVHQQL